MDNYYAWGAVAVIALLTAAIRFLPFVLFGGNKRIPPIIERLGAMLPYAIMGMLVVYCLKDMSFDGFSGFLPPLLSSLVVGGLYVWRKNTLLSIIAGTACYMLLVQFVF